MTIMLLSNLMIGSSSIKVKNTVNPIKFRKLA